jgi:cytochrome P450
MTDCALTFPFDHHDPEFVIRHRAIYDGMRQRCPVARTDAHGGYWVLSNYALVSEVALDDLSYSSAISLLVPAGNVDRLFPLQTDPPELVRNRLAIQSGGDRPRPLA